MAEQVELDALQYADGSMSHSSPNGSRPHSSPISRRSSPPLEFTQQQYQQQYQYQQQQTQPTQQTQAAPSSSHPHHRSHRHGHSSSVRTASHWDQALSSSPQLRSELTAAGVNVSALADYSRAARSVGVPLKMLDSFLDPKARGSPMGRTAGFQPLTNTASTDRTPAFGTGRDPRSANATSRMMSEVGWNNSAALDWTLLNGSRELSLLCTETALRHPDTEAGAFAQSRLEAAEAINRTGEYSAAAGSRTTDRRTGHKLNFPLPPKRRFGWDAAYGRLEDNRKGAEGRAPERRLPPPRLWYGECLESDAVNDNEKRALEVDRKMKAERREWIADHSRTRWGMVDNPQLRNKEEWVNTQQKKRAITGCPSATENTYNRLFQLDVPSVTGANGIFLSARDSAAVRREQNIRDRTSHGRDFDPISNARIQTIPPSQQAQWDFKMKAPNAIGRFNQDQRNGAQYEQKQQE